MMMNIVAELGYCLLLSEVVSRLTNLCTRRSYVFSNGVSFSFAKLTY